MPVCLKSLSPTLHASVASCACGRAACSASPRICTLTPLFALRVRSSSRARLACCASARADVNRNAYDSNMMHTPTSAKKLAKKEKELKRLLEARVDVNELHSEPTIHEAPVSALALSPALFSRPRSDAP